MSDINPLWIAPREGQNWRDEIILRTTNWLRSFVPQTEMDRRIDAVRDHFLQAKLHWLQGDYWPAYDPKDTAAWLIFQAENFAADRTYCSPDHAAQIAPYLSRIGAEFDMVKAIDGADDRAANLMLRDRAQPESGIFELLVAIAYKQRGWTAVRFVPEEPGIRRTPDLHVSKPGTRWAVECKRMRKSCYVKLEEALGRKLAKPVHALSECLGKSFVVEVRYKTDLQDVADDYLHNHVQAILNGDLDPEYSDDTADILVRDVMWNIARSVLAHDYVYFGSSRMIEILAGHYEHSAQHSFSARWRPAREKPFYADSIYHAPIVSWINYSAKSLQAKAKHFRKKLAEAESQLPSDCPSAIHIGIESFRQADVAYLQHEFNIYASQSFEPRNSRLRWVYGNYFLPEVTTHKNESWAFVESMAPYKVGSHRTPEPLPRHLLVSSEDDARDGLHWDGSAS